MNHLRIAAVSLLALTGAPTSAPAQGPGEFVELLRKGLATAARSERDVGGYRCEHDAAYPGPSNTKSERHSRNHVLRKGDQVLLEAEIAEARAATRQVRLCLAADYMFGLSGTGAGPVWGLVQFKRQDREAAFREALTTFTPVVFPLRAVTQQWTLDDLVEQPTFAVHSVRARPDGRIDGDFSVEKNVSPEAPATLKGTLTLSPRHEHAVAECQYTLSIASFYQSRMTRTLSEPGEPLRCLKLHFQSVTTSTGAVSFKDDYTFSDYSADAPARDVFTLEHYGIPAPADDLRPTYLQWQFWAAAAIITIALALVFRRLARRRERTQPS